MNMNGRNWLYDWTGCLSSQLARWGRCWGPAAGADAAGNGIVSVPLYNSVDGNGNGNGNDVVVRMKWMMWVGGSWMAHAVKRNIHSPIYTFWFSFCYSKLTLFIRNSIFRFSHVYIFIFSQKTVLWQQFSSYSKYI